MNVERFWEENRLCEGKPFRTDKPRAPLTLGLDDHWLLDNLGIASTRRYYLDAEYRAEVNRSGNARCNTEIGLAPFSEEVQLPGPRRIEELMGCKVEIVDGSTPWLEAGYEAAPELEKALEAFERMDGTALLDRALEGGRTRRQAPGERVQWSRGPATVATSVLGTERFLTWLYDEPELMERFFDVLAQVMIRYYEALAEAEGAAIRGMAWLDDNCALLSAPMYERFCYPCLKRVTQRFAPRPDDFRFQHSDSAMEHLLPILATLNLHGVNLGPTLSAVSIRKQLPRAAIHGQVAPMTVRNGSREEIEAEVRRDFEAVGADGGLVLTTAGSIPAGTSFESIRWLMEAVETRCRYDVKVEARR